MPLTNYFGLSGGLNITDSPLYIKDNQATGQSYNYDYLRTGAISKVNGHVQANTVADTQLRTLGLPQYYNTLGTDKSLLRAAGTKLQLVDTSDFDFTNITEDTAAVNSDFFTSNQQVVSSAFNAATGAVTWIAGGNASTILGYNGSKVIRNGVESPTTSVFTATPVGSGGSFISGSYRWTLIFRKASTQAVSNAIQATEASATVVTNDSVNLAWTLTNNDTTKYDQILVYRSAVSGSPGFTTGSLVAQLSSTATNYLDTGSSIVDAITIPRAGNTTDNSLLPNGIYKTLTTFKRRLVTAKESTVYLSDFDKPESWPIANTITIPSGGPITGVAIIGFNSPFSQGIDEFLVVFKEREIWAVDGTSIDDWQLKFIDNVGCATQTLVVPMSGFLAWVDFRGIYMWDGAGKPVYCSRPIEALFSLDGDLDKTKLGVGWGMFARQSNQIIWRLSHRTEGENKISVKLDIRLTIPQTSQQLDAKVLEGVFTFDKERTLYAGSSFLLNDGTELLMSGDASGYLYNLYSGSSNPGGTGVQFTYETRPLDMGNPALKKRYKKVIAWIERITVGDFLTLRYWTDYRQRSTVQSTVKELMDPTSNILAALWDVAYWDISYWDDYQPDIGPVVFYLHSNENNAEGDTLKLKFEQLDPNVPVRIHGITVEWEEIGDTR